MKNNKYKILSTICYLVVLGFSISFSFFGNVKGNYLYWIMKGIASAWLLFKAISVFFPKAHFSGIFPTTITCFVMQFVPLLARIGYGNEGSAHIILCYVCSFITFILIAVSLLFTFSNQDYRKHENDVPRSSNKI